MAYKEEEYLQLSGIQHFRFCRRQWALIHIEDQWAENIRTAEGELLHERAHDPGLREKRSDRILVHDLAVFSPKRTVCGSIIWAITMKPRLSTSVRKPATGRRMF